MKLDAALYRNSVMFFALFLGSMIVAFWPSYFWRLAAQPDLRFHTHGVPMVAWCVLLVAQGLLIRTNRRALHRTLGKVAYFVAAALVVTTVSFIQYRVGPVPNGVTTLPASVGYFLALTLNSIVAFSVLFGLAVYYRKRPAIHARYMVCTVLPFITPVSDRLLGAHVPAVAGLVPRVAGAPVLPVVGFLLADLILVGLMVWDWRSNRRFGVFAVALVVLGAYHVSVLTFHALPFWQSFGLWFLGLPLS